MGKSEQIRISEENLGLSKKFFYLSIISLIVMIIFSITIPIYNVHNEKTKQINQVISEINSLELELKKNLQILNLHNDNPSLFVENWRHPEYIMENLKKSVSNGDIRNESIKSALIVLQVAMEETNVLMNNVNSPQITLLNDTEYFKWKYKVGNDIYNFNEDEIRPHIDYLLESFGPYKKCIRTTRNFEKC